MSMIFSRTSRADLRSSTLNTNSVAALQNSQQNEENGHSSAEHEIRCEACERDDTDPDQELHFCYACDYVFCDTCWFTQLPHRRRQRGSSAVVHEQTNPWVAKQVQKALSPPTDENVYAKLCAQDHHTAWFGIDRGNNEAEVLMFQDHGRYAEIIAGTKDDRRKDRGSWDSESSQTHVPDTRTPSLVSFVGQSGAGKSTLINLLVTLKGGRKVKSSTPVVGMTGRDVPTSEDVHLYSDPASEMSETPLLYADCEGLEGGEREPLGSRFRQPRQDVNDPQSALNPPAPLGKYGSERELVWADTTLRRSRQFAVTHLYPRLLYTFSDTIVFVLKNPRVIESVFEKLIEWAAAALETSSNQPVLPCAIIALNASEINIPAEQWESGVVTKTLLDSLSQTVHSNSIFQKYAQFWTERSRRIDTLEDLILSYYSSVQIVRIPSAGRPKLVEEQVLKLYDAIELGCQTVRETKRSLRMLLNAIELQSYLHCAFDHFALTLDEAFDFVQASFLNNPIPLDFGGNILRLAIRMVNQHGHRRPDPREIFARLSALVASCIMLDSVRHEIRGTADRIFPEYLDHLNFALEDFCNRHWPCEYTAEGAEYSKALQHFDGITGHRNLAVLARRSVCVNVRSGHGSKGHQTKHGAIFAAGNYTSSITFENYHQEFYNNVYSRLDFLMRLLDERTRSGQSQDTVAHAIHKQETLSSFYITPRGKKNISIHNHSVCLCCLFEQPEHVLPCGHMLCTTCVRSYGQVKGKTLVEMHGCPMDVGPPGSFATTTIYIKPDAAGSRTLVLDGGGIRSVVQLEVLRHLEREWKGELSIRHFFDLIVGAGTGGIIALGLTKQGWSLDKCAFYVEHICDRAFGKRTGRGIPGLGTLIESYRKSKYDTDALDDAIRDTFDKEQSLFGGVELGETSLCPTKVAVVATSSNGTPVLMADYNRPCTERLRYQFHRPDRMDFELKTWEAARATMTVPKLFKPFLQIPSYQKYTSADADHSNPISLADKERKLIWSEKDFPNAPDLILSLGTGLDGEHLQSSAQSIQSTPSRGSLVRFGSQKAPRTSSPTRLQNTSDNFIRTFPPSDPRLTFIRFNPLSMMQLPAGDDIAQMKNLRILARPHIDKREIENIAAKLLAALFYFESIDDLSESTNVQCTAQGFLLCRLPNGTPEVRGLGKLMKDKSIDVKPRLVVREGTLGPQFFEISQAVIENMILNANFAMPSIEIAISHKLAIVDAILRLDNDAGHSISGFPRSLVKQETRAMRHRQALLAKRLAASKSDNSSIYSKTSRSWRPPGSDRAISERGASERAPSERAPSVASGTLSPTTASFSLRSGLSSPRPERQPSGASLATTPSSIHNDPDRPTTLARHLSKTSGMSSNSSIVSNDPQGPNSNARGYFSTVAPPNGAHAPQSPAVSTNAFASFASQGRSTASAVPLPMERASSSPTSPRKEPPFSPASIGKTVPTFAPGTIAKVQNISNGHSLRIRDPQRSPTIAEGLYELDAVPQKHSIDVKDLEASDVVNPYMKPETKKDVILKEVRDAKERVRKEEVAPLEERLRALEAMVLRMAQQESTRGM